MKRVREWKKEHNDTHLSTRLTRAELDVFNALHVDASKSAAKHGLPTPSRSKVVRAAVRYMLKTAAGGSREEWVHDIIDVG